MATTFVDSTRAGFVRVTQLAKSVKTQLETTAGDLTTLSTSAKSSLVAALNELHQSIQGLNTTDVMDTVTDGTHTWSSSKISTEITNAINTLINGADVDSDSLKELADKIAAIAQADAGLLSLTQAQSFTPEQQTQGRSNLGLGSLATKNTEIDDVATALTTTWSSTKINTEIGNAVAGVNADTLNTSTDFVAAVDSAWNGTP